MTQPRGAPHRVTLAASGVVVDDKGRFLLVERTTEPEAGAWSVPGGTVEPGETLPEAAAREVHEETGIEIEVLHELWTVELPAPDGTVFEVHDFLARPTGGRLEAADDAADARWVSGEEMLSLPLTTGLLRYLREAGLVT